MNKETEEERLAGKWDLTKLIECSNSYTSLIVYACQSSNERIKTKKKLFEKSEEVNKASQEKQRLREKEIVEPMKAVKGSRKASGSRSEAIVALVEGQDKKLMDILQDKECREENQLSL